MSDMAFGLENALPSIPEKSERRESRARLLPALLFHPVMINPEGACGPQRALPSNQNKGHTRLGLESGCQPEISTTPGRPPRMKTTDFDGAENAGGTVRTLIRMLPHAEVIAHTCARSHKSR